MAFGEKVNVFASIRQLFLISSLLLQTLCTVNIGLFYLHIMLTTIHPKLPMRSKAAIQQFYITQLGFEQIGDYPDYLMVKKDSIEIHFFLFKTLNPLENYGQVYIRMNDIEQLYALCIEKNLSMPAAGHLQTKPWSQKEFSLLDPDHNLLTFGEAV